MALTSAVTTSTTFTIEDVLVVIVYFVGVIAVGLYASCRASRGTVSGYFLAGRNMNFAMVGASLFVSNIGSEHFIGLAGTGAAEGIGPGAWEFNAILILQLLGFVFLPVYLASQIYTVPEFLNKRFGGQRLRVFFSVVSIILCIICRCSIVLFTGALFIQQSLGWDLYLSIFILIAIVTLLTMTGGLTAVMYTDTFQALLMVVGALTLTLMSFAEVGWFNGLWERYPHAVPNVTYANSTCTGDVDPNWNVLLRDPSDNDIPWVGFLLGQTPGSIWYWCTDQVIVQRALAAKNLSHAQGATIMAGFIKILPFFIIVLPGMISRVLYPNEVACVDPDVCFEVCQSRAGCYNIAYPKLVLGIMPTGLRGLMMAVMIAAIMSDLDSIFNSASSIFTLDIWRRLRKSVTVREEMIVGRIFLVIMAGLSIAMVPITKEMNNGQTFIYMLETANYFGPQAAAVYLMAVLWPRCNEKGAFWGLMSGVILGAARLILIFIYQAPSPCSDEEDPRPFILKHVQYMYYAVFLFLFTIFVTMIISLCTEPPNYHQLYRTTFWTRYDDEDVKLLEADKITVEWGFASFCMKGKHRGRLECETDMQSMLTESEKTENVNHENKVISENTTSDLVICDDKGHSDADNLSRKERLSRFCLSWFCGVSNETSTHDDTSDTEASNSETGKLALQQSRSMTIFLHVMLVIILAVGVFQFCFWSLWKYEVASS